MTDMKELAIIGPTASGKTALAVEIARKFDANILSLDSLAIYRGVDIVSARPTAAEMGGVRHFGIDLLEIDAYFSAATFFDLYLEAARQSRQEGKNLVIVGGTSFYLKALTQGLSPKLTLSPDNRAALAEYLRDPGSAYRTIRQKDPRYAEKITPADRYRIGKWYEIYLGSGMIATDFFRANDRKPVIDSLPVFDIAIDRELLRERIALRTSQMIENGLVEEVFALERRYGRTPHPMKAIGIRESLDYLDGKLTLQQLHVQISTHTAQLAKRQETFNTSQFPQRIKLLKNDLIKEISKLFN